MKNSHLEGSQLDENIRIIWSLFLRIDLGNNDQKYLAILNPFSILSINIIVLDISDMLPPAYGINTSSFLNPLYLICLTM